MKIRVVNKKLEGEYPGEVYIGRGSVLGNKFIIGRDGGREEVIEKYRVWLEKEMAKKGEVYNYMVYLLKRAGRTKVLNLSCYCKPLPCHGDVVAERLIQLRKELRRAVRV